MTDRVTDNLPACCTHFLHKYEQQRISARPLMPDADAWHVIVWLTAENSWLLKRAVSDGP